MKEKKTLQLYDQKQAVEFYEDRYEQGYMDEWPPEKKTRVFEVIRGLELPDKGEALDFGCGNGVLTEIIRQALPSWKIYGTDISNKAIANASIRYPGCTFFEASDPEFKSKRFDLIFTNHVFEHVFNLNEVFVQMDGYLKPASSMIHILPCGNPGSYEYNICLLRNDGINSEFENRFFFEDEGHVRRLTTDQFSELCKTKGFELQKEFYSNQYYGAIEWITNSGPKFVWMFSDTSKAINKDARRILREERVRLICIAALRMPAQVVNKLMSKRNKQLKHYIYLLVGFLLYPVSAPINNYWERRSQQEWSTKSHNRNGSEMYLCFKRG